jgi:hypothetical protein
MGDSIVVAIVLSPLQLAADRSNWVGQQKLMQQRSPANVLDDAS